MMRFFFLAVGMFAMGCEDYLFEGLLPKISNSINTTVVTAAQGGVAFGLAYVISIPLCAYLLSRLAVRQVLLGALFLFIIGNVISVLATDLSFYIISRFIAGIGGGLFLPVAVGAGAQMVEPAFRGRTLGAMWGANSAGAVFGVPVGLWLSMKMGWQVAIFLILAVASFALAGLLFRKQTLQIEAPPPTLGSQMRLLLNGGVLRVIFVTFLTSTGCLGLYTYISQFLEGSQLLPELAYSFWSLGGLVGSLGIGYVVDRFGKPQVVMATILAILFLSVLAIPLLSSAPIVGLLPFMIWGAMGWASMTPQQLTLFRLKADHEAILVALNSSAVSLGSVVGTALGGMALAAGLDSVHLPYVTAIFLICALTFQLRWIVLECRA